MHRKFAAYTLCLGLLAGCQGYPTATTVASSNAASTVSAPLAPSQGVLLQGRVVFPGYAVKATLEEVRGLATVSLIDPADGATLAAGTTDTDGNFTLYKSTTPYNLVEGQSYVLEVSKRLGKAQSGQPHLSLRTLLRREANQSWTSITGPTITVNVTTTALARIIEDDAAVTADMLMNIYPDGTAVTEFGDYTGERITARVAELSQRFADNQDPNGGLTLDAPDGVVIATAADVKELRRYEIVNGDITVDPAFDGGLLDLPRLKRVNGNITIVGVGSGLQGLGLGSLQAVEGNLSIERNVEIWRAAGLESLVRVEGTLSFAKVSGGRTDLKGFANLESAGALKLKNVMNWPEVDGHLLEAFQNLRTLGALDLEGVVGLESLAGFPALTSLDSLRVHHCSQFTTLAGLPDGVKLSGSLDLYRVYNYETSYFSLEDLPISEAGLSGPINVVDSHVCEAEAQAFAASHKASSDTPVGIHWNSGGCP
jgi:hypothetical protein